MRLAALSGLTPGQFTSISSTNNHALLPTPELFSGMVPKLTSLILIYLAVTDCATVMIPFPLAPFVSNLSVFPISVNVVPSVEVNTCIDFGRQIQFDITSRTCAFTLLICCTEPRSIRASQSVPLNPKNSFLFPIPLSFCTPFTKVKAPSAW